MTPTPSPGRCYCPCSVSAWGGAQTIETYSFTNLTLPLPDDNASGLSDVHILTSAIAYTASVRVKLHVTGEFNGDLFAYLRHVTTAETNYCVLLNRPGRTASNRYGYPDSGLDVTFQTGASNGDIHVYRDTTTPAAGCPLTGDWEPDGRAVDPTNATDISERSTSLTNFIGTDAAGQWTLFLADLDSGGSNLLAEWDQQIAELSFSAVPNEHSAFVKLPLTSVSANKPDGSSYVNYITHAAEVAVVQVEPLLSASVSAARGRNLTLFGKLGVNYQLQYSTNVALPGFWSPLLDYCQTQGVMTVNVSSGNPNIFYRLVQH